MLEDPTITKVFHNAKVELQALELGLGVVAAGTIHDTQLASWICETYSPHPTLEDASTKWLGTEGNPLFHLQYLAQTQKSYAVKQGWLEKSDDAKDCLWLVQAVGRHPEVISEFTIQSAINVLKIWDVLQERLEEEKSSAIYELEQSLLPIVMRMENRGLRLDHSLCLDQIETYRHQLQDTLRQLRELTGNPNFDPEKPKHVHQLLYETLGLKPSAFTPTGQSKTDQRTLAAFSEFPAARLIIEARAFKRASDSLAALFVAGVRDRPGKRRHSVHSTLKQDGTRTGRFSSSNPPLHSASDGESSRSKFSLSTRDPLGPREGYVWLAVDFSQIEALIFTIASEQLLYTDRLSFKGDLHSDVANVIWGGEDNPRAIQAAMSLLKARSRSKALSWLKSFDYQIVEAEQSLNGNSYRGRAKSLVYGRLMGGGVTPVMEELQCSEEEARSLLSALDRAIPRVRQFLKEAERVARRDGYSKTFFGRRLHHREKDHWLAASHIIQGTGANLIKRRMIACDTHFQRRGLDVHLILQIHDELIFEVHESIYTPGLVKMIRQIMEADGKVLGIDLPVNFSLITESWSQKEKVNVSRPAPGRIIRWRGKTIRLPAKPESSMQRKG